MASGEWLAVLLVEAAAFVWGVLPLLALRGVRPGESAVWSVIVGVGGALLLAAAVAGGSSGLDRHYILPGPLSLGVARFAFRIDALACWFLALIAIVAVALAPYLGGYARHLRKGVDLRLFWIGLPWLLLSMSLVVMSANAVCFLVFWEMMSLTSFLLVATDHEPRSTRQAALVYLGATRLGTALIIGGFLWTHFLTGTWTFSDWHLHGAAALGPGLLVLCGLCVKGGSWPFHLWLPIAHPVAPAPVSALMSGVMVKVAIAIIVRLFLFDPAYSHPAFGVVLLALGAISAFWGVLFALLQHDLKRLLAYHTVENIGLIMIGLGVSLVARRIGAPAVATIALAAALFHALNHALFKSLLFLGAGAVDAGAGTRDLDHLGGLGRRMPWTYACFVLGAAAICGLPPLNGFASEWLLYQGAFRLAVAAAHPALRFAGMLLIGWISLVGALAVACFIKAIGVTFQGRPRSASAEHAHECDPGMRASQGLLAVLCVALGLDAPAVLRAMLPMCSHASGGSPPLSSLWTLPFDPATALLLLTAAAGALWMAAAEQRRPRRTYITWECGFGDLGPRAQVSAGSFVQPIMRMFGALYRYSVHLKTNGGDDPHHFPEGLTAETSTESVMEIRVYRPIAKWFSLAGDAVVHLQAGSIHRYLLTMFATLFVLLVIGGYLR